MLLTHVVHDVQILQQIAVSYKQIAYITYATNCKFYNQTNSSIFVHDVQILQLQTNSSILHMLLTHVVHARANSTTK